MSSYKHIISNQSISTNLAPLAYLVMNETQYVEIILLYISILTTTILSIGDLMEILV